jgi:hypothetical protein
MRDLTPRLSRSIWLVSEMTACRRPGTGVAARRSRSRCHDVPTGSFSPVIDRMSLSTDSSRV